MCRLYVALQSFSVTEFGVSFGTKCFVLYFNLRSIHWLQVTQYLIYDLPQRELAFVWYFANINCTQKTYEEIFNERKMLIASLGAYDKMLVILWIIPGGLWLLIFQRYVM